jgi:hypothetical protein
VKGGSVKVIKTDDGRYAIQYPQGLTRTRYYTQAYAEHIAQRMASRLGLTLAV